MTPESRLKEIETHYWGSAPKHISWLIEQLKASWAREAVAEKALKWYQNRDNWRDKEADKLIQSGGFFPYTLEDCPIAEDQGFKARETLATLTAMKEEST